MERWRILVVDDLPDVRITISGLLTDSGYDVYSVSSKEDAIKNLASKKFNVAVLDVRLDETNEDNQDGLELMYEIKKNHPDIATIILTGYADVKVVREALQPGVDGISPAFGFLEKTEIDHLPELINHVLMNKKRSGALSLREMILKGESSRIEFKSSIRWDYSTQSVNRGLQEAIVKTIAGMLNSDGGILIIGVSDNGDILGVEKDIESLPKRNLDGFELALMDMIQAYIGLEYSQYLKFRFEEFDGKTVCALFIDKSPKPVFFQKGDDNKFWVRTGNSTRSLDVKATTNYIETHWSK